MKALIFVSVQFALGLSPLCARQEVATPPQSIPLIAVECEDGEGLGDEAFEAELWATRLADPDLDLRMAAYEAITEAGGERSDVFRALKKWAEDTSRGELAWTARMALREISQAPEPQEDRWGFGTSDLDGLQGVWPEQNALDFERSLMNRFDQLQRRMAHGLAPGAVPGQGVVQRIFRLDYGPNGWRLGTQRVDSEGETEQHWEADTIEALLNAHPELEEEFPGLGGLRLRFGSPTESRVPPAPAEDGGPRTDVLGVECRPLTQSELEAVVARHQGQGLLVARTVPGSIADELGVRRGDILTRINGAPLELPKHITQALARREPAASVHLHLIDAQGQFRSLVWSPERLGGLIPPN